MDIQPDATANFTEILEVCSIICWKWTIYVSELFPCSSCEEINELDSNARSGRYVITTSDGKTLEQVSLVLLKLL